MEKNLDQMAAMWFLEQKGRIMYNDVIENVLVPYSIREYVFHENEFLKDFVRFLDDRGLKAVFSKTHNDYGTRHNPYAQRAEVIMKIKIK